MNSLSYRHDIDGLRAIAVMAVVFYHAGWKLFNGGYLGVDVFFVISGFLITSLIMKDLGAGNFTLAGFWERRVRRIIPPLLPVLVFTIISGWFFLLPYDYTHLGQQLMSQAVFSSNMLFAAQSGYFDTSQSKPLLHTWSLAVEEQFYLFFPFLLTIPLSRQLNRIPLYLFFGLLLSYSVCIWGDLYYPDAAFYLLPMRAWELFLGALIVFIPDIPLARWEKELISFFGIAVILIAMLFYKDTETSNAWLVALQPCAGTFLLLWSGRSAPGTAHNMLSWPLLVGIGLISYSLYLWHWPLLFYLNYTAVEKPDIWSVSLTISLSAIMALASWAFVEKPIRQKIFLKTRKNLFIVLLSTLFVIALTGSGISYFKGLPSRFSSPINLLAAGANDDNPRKNECFTQELADLGKRGLCKLGRVTNGTPRFLAFGDSTLDALMPALDMLGQHYNVAGLLASYDSCPLFLALAALTNRSLSIVILLTILFLKI